MEQQGSTIKLDPKMEQHDLRKRVPRPALFVNGAALISFFFFNNTPLIITHFLLGVNTFVPQLLEVAVLTNILGYDIII